LKEKGAKMGRKPVLAPFVFLKMAKRFQILWLILLLTAPVLLWLLPGDTFDNTGITLCPSKALFGMECLGCGMTRAVMHFHHFQFAAAFQFNKGVVVAYSTLVVVWGIWVRQAANKLRLW